MLEALRFVQGAVAKKDFVPALTHFNITNNHIIGFNGALSLCTPIDLELEAKPVAKDFVKAIATCQDETTALHLTAGGKLAIKSGPFKAFIKCTIDPFPETAPKGDIIELNDQFMDAIKLLSPFMAEDASRPWACGILFKEGSAFATNNIVIIEKWLGYKFPLELNVPAMAIKELLRVKQNPISMQVCSNSVTFHFEGGRWLKSQLCDMGWPDVSGILNRDSNAIPVPEGFFEALDMLKPFGDEIGRAYFSEVGISTSGNDEDGMSVDLVGLPDKGCFSLKPLLCLNEVAKTIDFTSYPSPSCFFGDNVRGVIVGISTE